MPIYHLTTRAAWKQAQAEGRYTAPSLTAEGFIHASTEAQIERVANAFYRDVMDCVLLVIHPDQLTVPLKWEDPVHPHQTSADTPASTELFPHIYGAIDLAAVATVMDFPLGADGNYHFPVKSDPA